MVRGSVQMITLAASPLHQFTSTELRLTDVSRCQALHSELNDRQEARRKQYRFRKSPERYLLDLEEKPIKARLLS